MLSEVRSYRDLSPAFGQFEMVEAIEMLKQRLVSTGFHLRHGLRGYASG